MTDLFSELDVGEALEAQLVLSFKSEAAIAKGSPVKMSTHTAGEIGSVAGCSAGDKAIGIAMRAAAAAGEYIPVLIVGVVKVTADGAISVGNPVKAAGADKVAEAVRTVTIPSGATTVTSTSAQPSMTVESGIAFGFALQTFADGDTGLIAVGMGMP